MALNQDNEEIRTLEWDEHIRIRPGMYIGKLGDGSAHDDGIYVLLKEVMDNSIDEFMKGHGKLIEVTVKEQTAVVRDYGRGIPLDKMVDCVSKINTGRNFSDNETIGMNGVGTKAVNALSTYFKVVSVCDGLKKSAEFSCGKKTSETNVEATDERSGTLIEFTPDDTIFENFHWYLEYIEKMMWNYVYLNRGLVINFNGARFTSKNGLLDLLNNNLNGDPLYEPIHLQDGDFEFAMTHTSRKYGEDYYSFVNGQYTIHGGPHQQAFREAIVKTFRDYFKKEFDPSDIRNSIVAAFSIKVKGPIFESQTKTKLGSQLMAPGGQSIRNYVNDVVGRLLDNYLHIHTDVADIILKKIQEAEKERKAVASIKKNSKEIQKKVSLHNIKLRDCRYHFNGNENRGLETTLFITEGDSASGSITQARDADVQAVFSLKGKPKNAQKGNNKSFIYEKENVELSLLLAALNIEDGLDGLRYNNIVIATDADVDGMHIRLLLLTFFLRFFPDVINAGHVYILQTPLFRVRNKQKTIYCYSEEEKISAIKKLGARPEITRFKGLGEISPPEFKNFIGKNMRLEPVVLDSHTNIHKLLDYYMGNNTPQRQQFIIENLREEIDVATEEL
ncbi:MAG: type IIA DNA topoisomerase subunit B [Bacteroidales bacterium]|nr:type IIA DNA topoisomerase subunit B [Bacteroidales bacterium]MBQ7490341.1 type IIA DNA topoisomerase subunit B [Bacteroidales bacterium]